MPTYEYACSSCHNAWEEEQSIKADASTECPACHQQTAKRQISRGGGFILKGGGWYADAYSSSSNAKPPGESGSKSSEGTTTTSVTMDSETGKTTKTITKTMPDGSSDSQTRNVPTPTVLPTPSTPSTPSTPTTSS
jgi:putative FmdB family regulatory protein